jgi:hypothetical protein
MMNSVHKPPIEASEFRRGSPFMSARQSQSSAGCCYSSTLSVNAFLSPPQEQKNVLGHERQFR